MSRLIDGDAEPAETWDAYERMRLDCALTLDALPSIADNPNTPPGGFVAALADELGTTVEALMNWRTAQ